jgi:cell division protein FtsB
MLIGVFLLLLVAIVVANQGPMSDLMRGRAQLAAKEKQVADLQKGNEAYKAEIARLQQPSYLEALARKELAYAKPGEDVFIIRGASAPPSGSEVTPSVQAAQDAGDSVAAAAAASAGAATAPPHQGLLQRLLSAVRGLL